MIKNIAQNLEVTQSDQIRRKYKRFSLEFFFVSDIEKMMISEKFEEKFSREYDEL